MCVRELTQTHKYIYITIHSQHKVPGKRQDCPQNITLTLKVGRIIHHRNLK